MTGPDPGRGWQRYWRFLGFRRDVKEELTFHLEMLEADLIEQGLTPDQAAREAARRFGDPDRVQGSLERIERRRGRQVRTAMWLDETWQDIKYGIRNLIRRPGFTFAAAISLGLGLATVTVMYSLVDALLLRPLPVQHPEELVVLGGYLPGPPAAKEDGVAVPNYEAMRRQPHLFQSMAGYGFDHVTVRVTPAADGELGTMSATTGSYFPMLGLRPFLGRFYGPSEDEQREPVVVVSHSYWQRRLGSDPGIVGRTLLLGGKPFVVIGVTPPGFTSTLMVLAPDLFVPRRTERMLKQGRLGNDPVDFGDGMQVMARRYSDVSIDQVRAQLALLSRDLERQYPKENRALRFLAYPEINARPSIAVADSTPYVAFVFMALAGLVLVVACANVANLVLVRATSRAGELGLRQALGASRGRLVRQLLTETVMLSASGFGVAWLLASVGIRQIGTVTLLEDMPVRVPVSADWRVLGFAALVALVAGLLVGVFPAFAVTKSGLRQAVQDGSRASGGGTRHRNILVTLQLAVSVVALVSAGLFTRSIGQATRMDLGFRPERTLKTRIDPILAGYDRAGALVVFDKLLRNAQALPGVRHAAWATSLPLQSSNMWRISAFGAAPGPQRDGADHLDALANWVSGDYFDAMQIRRTGGRPFALSDDSLASPVAIINATGAKLFWPGKDPLGQTFRTARDGPPVTIVGVVEDSRYIFVNEPPRPFLYLPIGQGRWEYDSRVLILDVTGSPAGTINGLRQLVGAIDPNLVPMELATMEAYVHDSVSFLLLRWAAMIASAIGLLALIQAALGLYGVIAYSVLQRSRELGIRMALGADQGRVLALVVGQGGKLIGVGLGVGLVIAVVAGRLLRGFLVGVGAFDLLTFGGAVLVLAGVALLATYLPARRAARTNPITVLKQSA